jgi:hypothetical protein
MRYIRMENEREPGREPGSREVVCENCGRKAVHRRSGGRFCGTKCRVENWWRKKLGASKLVAMTALVVLAGGCGGPSDVSPLVGNYSGILQWTRDGEVIWDQLAEVRVAQQEGRLSVGGNVRYRLYPAPLLSMTCDLDGSSCSATGPAEDELCGHYELGSARLRRVGRSVLFEGTTSSRCDVRRFAGTLR